MYGNAVQKCNIHSEVYIKINTVPSMVYYFDTNIPVNYIFVNKEASTNQSMKLKMIFRVTIRLVILI